MGDDHWHEHSHMLGVYERTAHLCNNAPVYQHPDGYDRYPSFLWRQSGQNDMWIDGGIDCPKEHRIWGKCAPKLVKVDVWAAGPGKVDNLTLVDCQRKFIDFDSGSATPAGGCTLSPDGVGCSKQWRECK